MNDIITLQFSSQSLNGSVAPVRSKSESNRALIIQALCQHPFVIDHLSDSDDTRILQTALKQIAQAKENETITVDVHHAGTVMRFLTTYCAHTPGEYILKGSDRMHERPIHPLVDALRSIGAQITYLEKEGFPPIHIQGAKLKGGRLNIPSNISSQFISSLLLCAPNFDNGLQLALKGNGVSETYVHMTIRMMRYFEAIVERSENGWNVSPHAYVHHRYEVESDWSAASYFYALVALAKEASIELKGYRKQSWQGDQKVADYFTALGVQTNYVQDGIQLSKSATSSRSVEWNLIQCPDLAPTLAVTSAALGIEATLTGLQTLRIKESDRIAALEMELGKMGAHIESSQDQLHIRPSTLHLPDSPIQTYDDHRMAMSFAPLALLFPGLQIAHPQVVTKSYPDFWKDMTALGLQIQ